MVSFMACFVAALFRWFRRPSLLIHWILMASAILCINAKLTGLVYLCFGCAAGGLYVLMKRRDRFGPLRQPFSSRASCWAPWFSASIPL